MKHWLISLLLCATTFAAHADFPADIPAEKRTRLGYYLNAADAYAMKRERGSKVLFVDVRSKGEVQYVGVPDVMDAHVPYMEDSVFGEWDKKRGGYRMEVNSHFVTDVNAALTNAGLTRNDPVILICMAGHRSAKSADLLTEAGYTRVYSVVDGFEGDLALSGKRTVNGWKNAGLPWSYQLSENKVYRR